LIWADQKALELAQLADDEQKPKRRRKNEQWRNTQWHT
jgi:hypothetical protein